MNRSLIAVIGLIALGVSCGKDSPAAPTPTPTVPTRIVRLSGTLNFGSVAPGAQPPDQSFTVNNDGNANLSVSGMSAPCASSSMSVIGSVAFVIAPQQAIRVTVRFRPTAAQSCTGTIAVNSDATSGTNTISITAVAEGAPVPPPPPPPPSVEYRITGTARHCSATYENSTGGTNQQGVSIPFSYSWNSARLGDFLYMSCQIDQASDAGNITVAIYKNGTFYRSGFAAGFPNIATASGSY
jgi:HYDIN/CFA65/VesB-like, Ig-like domain